MKILAYGGNQHAIRNRTGEWPAELSAALGDTYGIPAELPSFGIVFPAGNPCLLYRERVPSPRGGYPYTLLIDLGPLEAPDSPLRKADWNAAALIYALFNPDSRWLTSLRSPESLNPNLIGSMLDQALQQQGLLNDLRRDDANDPSALWVLLLTGSLLTSGVAQANPTAFGLNARPSMKQVAAWISRAPMLSRTGRGWMVGGSPSQAKVFGAGVLVDDQPYSENADPSIVVERGQRMLTLLDSLRRWEPTSGIAEERLNTPPFQMNDLSLFFQRADLWERTLRGDESAFDEELPADGPLAEQILAAMRESGERKASSEMEIGPRHSYAILNTRARFAAPVSLCLTAHLDTQVLAQRLDREGVPPNRAERMDLPPQLSYSRCVEWLAKKNQETQDPLNECRKFLYSAHNVSTAEELESRLIRRSIEKLDRLSNWWSPDDPPLHQQLKTEAIRRLGGVPWQSAHCLLDGICYCEATEVNKLIEPLRGQLDEPVRRLLDLRRDAPDPTRIRTWLEDLGDSPLRESLAVPTRMQIAEVIKTGWRDLLQIVEAFQGKGRLSDIPVPKKKRLLVASEFLSLLRQRVRSGADLRVETRDLVDFVHRLGLVGDKEGPELLELAEFPTFAKYSRELALRRSTASKQVANAGATEELVSRDTADPLEEVVILYAAIEKLQDKALDPRIAYYGNPQQSGKDYDHLVDLICFGDFVPVQRVREPAAVFRKLSEDRVLAAVVVLLGLSLTVLVLSLLHFSWMPKSVHGLSVPNTAAGVVCALLVLIALRVFTWPRQYEVTLPEPVFDRLAKLLTILIRERDSYAISHRDELVRNLAKAEPTPIRLHSFTYALLLYIHDSAERMGVSVGNDPRLRKAIMDRIRSVLLPRKLIRRKGRFER